MFFLFIVFITAVIGYLLGSISTAIIVGRFHKIDIKKEGSGNAGLTNTLRTLGKKAAIIVLVGDMLKGVAAYAIGAVIFKIAGFPVAEGGIIAGIAAVAGHNFPVYFHFRGGKGVLTTFAVVMMTNPMAGLILLGIFLIITAVFRYISLSSVFTAICFPFIMMIFTKDQWIILPAFLLSVSVIIMHRENIKRLFSGDENKISFKKKNNTN